MTSLRICLGALLLSGCGLISSDVTNFDLTLPEKSFSVDASGWQVNQQQADMFLGLSCAGSPNTCSAGVTAACPMNCTGECSTTTNKCVLHMDVGVYQMIDLLKEKPELKTINDKAVIKVTIDSVTYRVPMNTLNVDTPQMTVYVAPMSIMDPKDPMAKPIGTIAPVKAGQSVGMADMAYTVDGKQNLMDTMGTYKNPFNVIVGSDLEIKQGDMVPTGKLDAVVQITAHAGI